MVINEDKPRLRKLEIVNSRPTDSDSSSCCWLPVVIVISYFILKSIFRVTQDDSGSLLDQIICYGTLIVLLVVMIWSMFATPKEH